MHIRSDVHAGEYKKTNGELLMLFVKKIKYFQMLSLQLVAQATDCHQRIIVPTIHYHVNFPFSGI